MTGANLGQAYLRGARLSGVVLDRATMTETELSGADLSRGRLVGANLTSACLRLANLTEASLERATVRGADLRQVVAVGTNFRGADLSGCSVYGISAWNIDLDGATQHDLVITPDGEGVVTADNLAVAQFLFMLLHNENLRDVIETVGRKAILVLGLRDLSWIVLERWTRTLHACAARSLLSGSSQQTFAREDRWPCRIQRRQQAQVS